MDGDSSICKVTHVSDALINTQLSWNLEVYTLYVLNRLLIPTAHLNGFLKKPSLVASYR